MFDFTLAIFQGSAQTATFLQFLPVENASMTFNQFGGVGPAKYTLNNLQYQNLTNLVAPNRVDAYRKFDTLSTSAASGQATLHVNVGSRFAVNQSVLVYDGVHSDFKTVASIAGNVLTLNGNLSGTYAVGATVLGLVHRGRLSTVEANANMTNTHVLQTTSYFQELVNFVPATASSDGRECGWFLFNLLSLYANSFDLNISAGNFAKSSDAAGAISGGGTGIGYMANNVNSPLLNVIQDVLNVANGSSTNTNTGNQGNTVWNFWVDLNNNVHFGQVDLTTATKTYSATTYTQTADGFFDMLTDHTTHDQDMTGLVNTYILLGGQASSAAGSSVKVTVFDQNSVNQYGQIEQVITLPNITSEATLKAIGTAKLNASAYPINQYRSTLSRTGVPPTCQDVILVKDLADSNLNIFYSEQFSAQTIELIWDVNKRDFLATRITGAQMLPNINSAMSAIAAQHYIPTTAVTGGLNITDRYVLQGVVGSYGGNTLFITAGVIVAATIAGGVVQSQYNVPTTTYSPTANGTWTVGYLYRNADGTQYATPQIVKYLGVAVPATAAYTNYQIIPLFTITAIGGVIISMADLRNLGGVSNANFQQNPSPSTAPVFAGSYTYASVTAGLAEYMPPAIGGASSSVSAQFTFGLTTTNPNWLFGLNLYAIPQGATFVKGGPGFRNTLAANATGVYTAIVDGLNPGANVDLYCTLLDNAGIETPGLKIATATPAALVVGSINQADMPTTAAPNAALSYLYNAAPYSSAPLVTTGAGGTTTGTNYNAELPFFTDGVGSTGTFWLFEIQLMARIHGGTNWQQVGTVAPTSTSNTADGSGVTEYVGIWTHLGMSNGYDLGVRYVSHKGRYSAITTILTNFSVALSAAALPSFAAGTTISASVNGSLSYSGVGGATYTVTVPFHLTISDTAYASKLKEIHVLAKQIAGSSTDGDTVATNYYDLATIAGPTYAGSGTALTANIPLGSSANNYEITIQVWDLRGNQITASPFIVATAQQINAPATVAGTDNSNLVASSGMSYTNGTASATGFGKDSYFTYAGYNATKFGVLTPGGTVNTSAINILATSTGASTLASICAYSEPINVSPGVTYCGTVTWATTNVVSGNFNFGIVPVSDKTANNGNPGGDAYAGANLLTGASGNAGATPSFTWTCPTVSPPAQVVFAMWAINVKANFYWTKPQFEIGTAYSGYKDGPAALVTGNTAHSASSTATQAVIDSAGTANPTTLNPAYGQAPHAAMSAQTTAVVGGTSGAPTLTVNPGGGVVGQLPLTAHDATVQNRNGMSYSCSGQSPYVNSSNQLVFPSNVRLIRPDGNRCDVPAGFGPITLPSTSGQVFLHWVAGGSANTDSVLAISRNTAGGVGVGYSATAASTNYEPFGAWDTTPSPYAFSFYGLNSNSAAATYNVVTDNGDGTGYVNVDRSHPLKIMPYVNLNGAITRNINSSGQNLATDLIGTVEADPSGSYPGFWISTGRTYFWQRGGQTNVNVGPQVLEWTGTATGATDLGVVLNAVGGGSTLGADAIPVSGYLVYVDHNGYLRIYKSTASAWSQVAVSAYNAVYTYAQYSYLCHLKVVTQLNGVGIQITAQFNGAPVLTYTDNSGAGILPNGSTALYNGGGTVLTHDFVNKHSLAEAQAITSGANVDSVSGNYISGVDFTRPHISKTHDYIGPGSTYVGMPIAAAQGTNTIDNPNFLTPAGAGETTGTGLSRWAVIENDSSMFNWIPNGNSLCIRGANGLVMPAGGTYYSYTVNGPGNISAVVAPYTFPCVPGEVFNIGLSPTSNIIVDNANPNIQFLSWIEVAWYGATSNYLSANGGGVQIAQFSNGQTFWTLPAQQVTAPANACYGLFRIVYRILNNSGATATLNGGRLDFNIFGPYCRKVSDLASETVGNLQLAKHDQVIQNRTAIHGGFEGAPAYMNGYTLTFPSTLDIFRPDGSYSYITGGSSVTCSGNTGYGFVFLVWNQNGAGSLLYVPRPSLSSVYTGSTAYELIGQTTGPYVFNSPYAANSSVMNAAQNVVTNNYDGTGYLNVDRAHPSKVLPRVSTHTSITNVIDAAGTVDVSVARNVLPRGSTHSDFTSTIGVGGGLSSSTAISKLIYNSVAYSTDMVLNVVIGAGPNYPVSVYISNQVGGNGTPTLQLPSAPTTNVNMTTFGTVASPIALPAPLTTSSTSDTIYIIASYSPGSTAGRTDAYSGNAFNAGGTNGGPWTLYVQKNAQFNAYIVEPLFADGFAISFTTASGGTFVGGLGGGGGRGGGGGARWK